MKIELTDWTRAFSFSVTCTNSFRGFFATTKAVESAESSGLFNSGILNSCFLIFKRLFCKQMLLRFREFGYFGAAFVNSQKVTKKAKQRHLQNDNCHSRKLSSSSGINKTCENILSILKIVFFGEYMKKVSWKHTVSWTEKSTEDPTFTISNWHYLKVSKNQTENQPWIQMTLVLSKKVSRKRKA